MLRVAVVGDIHYGLEEPRYHTLPINRLNKEADLFLIAGDLTETGTIAEIERCLQDLKKITIPIVCVLGNHDYNDDNETELAKLLEGENITVLEGESRVLTIGAVTVGIAGVKGFPGGYSNGMVHDFGEKILRDFAQLAKRQARGLANELTQLDTDYRVVLMHYAPIVETLQGENEEIFVWMGNQVFADAIDEAGADVVFHGHAHAGKRVGQTAKGIPVYNVAQPVMDKPYIVYIFE